MDSYDILLVLIVAGAGLGILQMVFGLLTWRAREAENVKAFALMQAIYKKARQAPLRLRNRPFKTPV